MEVVYGINSEFKRTPKFAMTGRTPAWQTSTYALPQDPTAWVELILGLYALGLLAWVLTQGIWWLIP
jgi:hypothetical protein